MMNIVLTGLVAGLTVTVALLAKDRNRYYTISNETIKELAILEKKYDELEADRDYWRDMAVEMTDRYIDELGVLDDFVDPTEEEINNPFAVEHIDGYDVTEAKYVRDANGNWIVVDTHYEKN